jgi:uncharacterized protein
MTADNKPRLSATDVLRRYKGEHLPAFDSVELTDVNQGSVTGERPLDMASGRGNLEEVRALIEGGADVDAPAEFGNTALHEAVAQGHHHVVEFLLNHGASQIVKNEFGDTPVDIAVRHRDGAMIKLLDARRSQS